tara:strand:+ start:48 stop:764 length:717 start_codon:yes stop_codon:yes gene_type:complete
MSIILNGTTGITTPDITSSGSLKIDASAPDNSLVVNSSGNVGIGTSTTTQRLNVFGPSVVQVLHNTDATSNDSHAAKITTFDSGAAHWNFLNFEASSFRFSGYGTERVRIDSAGRVTMPYQPAFNAIEGNTTGSLIFTQVISNVGNHYSTSTGRFTAPVSGHYLIAFTGGGNSTWGVDVEKNGTKIRRIEVGNPAGFYWSTVCSVIYMVAGDYVNCRAFIGTVSTSAYQGGFSGHLIG